MIIQPDDLILGHLCNYDKYLQLFPNKDYKLQKSYFFFQNYFLSLTLNNKSKIYIKSKW